MQGPNGHVVVAKAAELPVQQEEHIGEMAHGLSWNFGFVHPQSVGQSHPEYSQNLLMNVLGLVIHGTPPNHLREFRAEHPGRAGAR
jgi:hypothetical protein